MISHKAKAFYDDIKGRAGRAVNGIVRRVGIGRNKPMAIGSSLKRTRFKTKPRPSPKFADVLAKAIERQRGTESAPPKPRKQLPKMSKKRRQEMPDRDVCRRIVLQRCNGLCEIQVPGICMIVAGDVHEKLTRARQGSIIDPDNCVGTCRACHDHLVQNPAWATNAGLLISGHVAIEAVNEYAPSQREGRVA